MIVKISTKFSKVFKKNGVNNGVSEIIYVTKLSFCYFLCNVLDIYTIVIIKVIKLSIKNNKYNKIYYPLIHSINNVKMKKSERKNLHYKHFDLAQNLHNKHLYKDAIKEYQEAAKIMPDKFLPKHFSPQLFLTERIKKNKNTSQSHN